MKLVVTLILRKLLLQAPGVLIDYGGKELLCGCQKNVITTEEGV